MITTVDQLKSIPGKLYVRWSQSIKLDNTRGYSLRSGIAREAGLSACEVDQSWDAWRILRQLSEYSFAGGHCWIVTGDEVGRGADDEPLLANVQMVGKVSPALLSTDWRKMQLQAEIAEYEAQLTRITDTIGRSIVAKSLARKQAELAAKG